MASDTLRLHGTEAAIASDSNVGFAKMVRVLNNSGGTVLVTQKTAAGATVGTVSIYAYDCVNIKKAPSDTLIGVATTLAVSVSS
jgi:hypothetical protein